MGIVMMDSKQRWLLTHVQLCCGYGKDYLESKGDRKKFLD